MPDKVVEFLRSSRVLAESWADQGEIPLIEPEEKFECDIVDPADGSIKRTITQVASANGSVIEIDYNKDKRVVYKTADQNADFPVLVTGDFTIPIPNDDLEEWESHANLLLTEAVGWEASRDASDYPTFVLIRQEVEYVPELDETRTPDYGPKATDPNSGLNYLVGRSTNARVWTDIRLDGYINYEQLRTVGGDVTWELYGTSVWLNDEIRLSLRYLNDNLDEMGYTEGSWLTFTEKVWTQISLTGTLHAQTRVLRLQVEGRIVNPDSVADVAIDGPMTLTFDGVLKGIVGKIYQIGVSELRGRPGVVYI